MVCSELSKRIKCTIQVVIIVLLFLLPIVTGAKPALFEFETWHGTGSVSVDTPYDTAAFKSLNFNGIVDSASYSVKSNGAGTTITLYERYLAELGLSNGTHNLEAVFSEAELGSVTLNLYPIWSAETSSTTALVPTVSEVETYLGSMLLNGITVESSNYLYDETSRTVTFMQEFVDSLPEGFSLQAVLFYDDATVHLILPIDVQYNKLPDTSDPRLALLDVLVSLSLLTASLTIILLSARRFVAKRHLSL